MSYFYVDRKTAMLTKHARLGDVDGRRNKIRTGGQTWRAGATGQEEEATETRRCTAEEIRRRYYKRGMQLEVKINEGLGGAPRRSDEPT